MKYILSIITIFILSACATNVNEKTLNKQCYEVPKTGMCRAYFKIYYYDFTTKSCKSAVWGGCGGNVPFKSLQKCQNTCE